MQIFSKLAVNVRPIERQWIETCFHVLCDKIAIALLHHTKVEKNQETTEKVLFIKFVSRRRNIINVKQKGPDGLKKYPLQGTYCLQRR